MRLTELLPFAAIHNKQRRSQWFRSQIDTPVRRHNLSCVVASGTLLGGL